MKVSLLLILALSAFSSRFRIFKPMFSLLEKENNNAGNLEDSNGTKLAVGSLLLETSSELLGSSADGSSKTGSDSFLEIPRNGDSFLQTELSKGETRVGDMITDEIFKGNSDWFIQTGIELTQGGTRVSDIVTDGGYNGNGDIFLQTGIELTKSDTRSEDMISVDGFKSSSEDIF